MLLVLSPAKTLNFESRAKTKLFNQPVFLDESEELVEQLKVLETSDISSLMSVSEKLATLNSNRFLEWQRPFTLENSKQALLAFNGDVYEGLAAETLSEADLSWADQHLRILSGLYGLLKPLDLMQPYRLEMGTRFSNQRGKNLYEFWGDKITEKLNQEIEEQKSPVLINLASNEYFKAVKPKRLKGEVITPVFKDWKNGKYKVISFYAKKARGLMAAYIIQNRIEVTEKLKEFDSAGYLFSAEESSEKEWVFLRKDV
jgi:cytoplasmic iron level regulating protein YaaA (DUF328/UPF0246 family)